MAVDELHRVYYDRVLRFVRRLIGPGEAEDVTQEVFLRVARGSYQEEGRRDAWIFTVASNLCADVHRRRKPTRELSEVESKEDPAAQSERREMIEKLRAALREIPFDQRRVFQLREEGRLTFREIAERLGAPLGTVLARMKYAVDRIKKKLYEV